jgi:ceramide glucosyltransferase
MMPAWLWLGLALIGPASLLAGVALFLRHFRAGVTKPVDLPPITILMPLCGIDPELATNIESVLDQDYPTFMVCLCLESRDDSAWDIAMQFLPRVQLFVGAEQVGSNPKINNLIRAYRTASSDWVLISDSNARMERGFLRALAGQFVPGCGLVTAVVAGRLAEGAGGNLEVAYLNTWYPRWMLIAATMHFPLVIGKCMAIRKSIGERFGGLQAVAAYIAEDYVFGRLVKRNKASVRLLRQPTVQVIGKQTFASFWRRQNRWTVIRKVHAPLLFACEPLAYCYCSAAILGFGLNSRFGHFAAIAGAASLITSWFLLDAFVAARLSTRLSPKWALAWYVRESLALPLWISALVSSNILWRGKAYRLEVGGVSVSAHSTQATSMSTKQVGQS